MLSYEDARKIGVNACVDKLGREFVKQHKDTFCAADEDRGDHIRCFVDVSDKPLPDMNGELVLTSNNGFPYTARCTVDYLDGSVRFLNCVLPQLTV